MSKNHHGILTFCSSHTIARCLELLKPTLQREHPTQPELTRSGIIQALSLLVGFLDGIRPNAPNGRLCLKTKTTIQQVLDYTLNTSFRNMHPMPETFDWNWDFSTMFDFDNDPWSSFDWLNSEPQ